MKMKIFSCALVILLARAASAVSVTEFGAKGDGVTDDTAAVTSESVPILLLRRNAVRSRNAVYLKTPLG